MRNFNLIGIDIAKNIFQLVAIDNSGKIVFSKKLKRIELLPFIANLPQTLIAMEACGGAHHWARQFTALGHEVKLISAKYVRPFVKTNKNDFNDALAIAEAASRKTMPTVAIKTIEQQDIQSIHRLRERAVMQRTALGNQIRGLLAERGVVIAKTFCALKREIKDILNSSNPELSDLFKELIHNLYHEFLHYDEIVKNYEKQLQRIAKNNEVCQRLLKIPGVGPLTATYAITIATPQEFKNGRGFSAFIGLVPKQHSSGGKFCLLGISKRGDRYFRTLLIHGARAIITKLPNKQEEQNSWLQKLLERRGYHKTYVALANKNARIIFSLMKNNSEYQGSLAMSI